MFSKLWKKLFGKLSDKSGNVLEDKANMFQEFHNIDAEDENQALAQLIYSHQVIELNTQASRLYQQGLYNEGIEYAKTCISLSRQFLSELNPLFATSINNLALLYKTIGDYASAEPLYRQTIDIQNRFIQAIERTHKRADDEQLQLASSINNLGMLHHELGEYSTAIPLYKRAMDIKRLIVGKNHPSFATSLNNFGMLYYEMGDFVAAEPYLKQGLEVRQKVLEKKHPFIATSLNNLAMLYEAVGNNRAAKTLYKQSLEILDKEHPDFACTLNNLASLYKSKNDYVSAQLLYEKALKTVQANIGETNTTFATILGNLGLLFYETGDKDVKAEQYIKRALEIEGNILGKNHPNFATSLNNLAGLYQSSGNYISAEPNYKEAMEIRLAVLGEHHPDFAESVSNLGVLFAATNRNKEAMKMMEKLSIVDDRMIGQVFSFSAENQRAYYLKSIRFHFDLFFSLVNQCLSDSSSTAQSTLSLVLRRKAIESEALAMQCDAVLGGKYPESAPKLREITMLRAQITQKTLAGPGNEGLETHQDLLAKWNANKERLEAELARQIPEINLEQKLREIDRNVVAMALPVDSALIEFVRFDVFDFKAVPARGETQWKPAHYLAFILPAGKPDDLQMINLGEAEPIDRMIATFRAEVTGEEDGRGMDDLENVSHKSDNELFIEKGRELRKALFDKLLNAIGDRQRLFIAPDGNLTKLPFEILPTDDGGYLIDKYRISYLGVGRDLIRFGAASSGQPTAPMVAASPDFDLADMDLPNQPQEDQSRGRVSRDFDGSNMHFTPLPGTSIEGERIAEMLNVKPLLEATALESRLKACQSPRILHIATHGFFLQDQERDLEKEQRTAGMMDNFGMGRFAISNMENPLLRSGLALAGVNTWLKDGVLPEEAEDGILTAEDVTGLDLLATDLVVLSACETGLGEVSIGEGVLGLRRAFVLAGAKTLVMSLWKVPDLPTAILMERFYTNLLTEKMNRDEALREAQLFVRNVTVKEIRDKWLTDEMIERLAAGNVEIKLELRRLAKKSDARPFVNPRNWGAFICQGDPNQLVWDR